MTCNALQIGSFPKGAQLTIKVCVENHNWGSHPKDTAKISKIKALQGLTRWPPPVQEVNGDGGGSLKSKTQEPRLRPLLKCKSNPKTCK